MLRYPTLPDISFQTRSPVVRKRNNANEKSLLIVRDPRWQWHVVLFANHCLVGGIGEFILLDFFRRVPHARMSFSICRSRAIKYCSSKCQFLVKAADAYAPTANLRQARWRRPYRAGSRWCSSTPVRSCRRFSSRIVALTPRPSGRFADFSEIGVHTCLCLKLVGGKGCGGSSMLLSMPPGIAPGLGCTKP